VIVPPEAPSWTDQVTAWFAEFATDAAKEVEPPVLREMLVGLTVTATGGGGAVTVMVAVADLDVSATLRAITW
jgi:hypothetical protein